MSLNSDSPKMFDNNYESVQIVKALILSSFALPVVLCEKALKLNTIKLLNMTGLWYISTLEMNMVRFLGNCIYFKE